MPQQLNKEHYEAVRKEIRNVVFGGYKVEDAYENLQRMGYSAETALLVLAAGTACQ